MNSSFEEFSNNNGRIFHGDALEVLKQIPDESVDLIFVDPPYNIGKNFAGRKDKWNTDKDYLDWCYQWIDLCIKKVKPNGSLYLMTSTQFMPMFETRYLFCQELSGRTIVLVFKLKNILAQCMSLYCFVSRTRKITFLILTKFLLRQKLVQSVN